ncbi:tyrosine-type recombinase/integrase [Sulfitobacter sp. 1A13421]
MGRGFRLHLIRSMPASRLAGRPTPAILVPPEDGLVLIDAWRFLTEFPYANRSDSWKGAAARTIGKFFDYYKMQGETEPCDPFLANQLINRFLSSLSNGTISVDGNDPSGLYWHPASRQVYDQSRTYLKCFVEKLEDFHSNSALKATSFYNAARQARNSERQQSQSLLYHCATNSDRTLYPPSNNFGQTQASNRAVEFPEKKLNDLIWLGCKRKRAVPEFYDSNGRPTIASEYNINLMMAIALMAGAGLRKSELFHLFVEDVWSPKNIVYLYHPERGVHRQPEGPTVTRQEYLMQEFGRIPRRRMRGNQQVGWKSLLITDASNERSECYFLPKWESLFFRLFQEYRDRVLPDNVDHPYLFVSLDRDHFGQPWTSKALTKQFSAAVNSIGLVSKAEHGTTPHGCRHYYGQSLTDMGLSPVIIQQCMHHLSITSQVAYTRPTPLKVNAALKKAHAEMKTKFGQAGGGIEYDIVKGHSMCRYRSDPSGVFTEQNLGFGKDKIDG